MPRYTSVYLMETMRSRATTAAELEDKYKNTNSLVLLLPPLSTIAV